LSLNSLKNGPVRTMIRSETAVDHYAASRNYLESRILSARPLELVVILHEGALQSIRYARAYLREGDTRARGCAINKAQDFVGELLGAVDLEKGGPLSTKLVGLYRNILWQLATAHVQAADPPLAQVELAMSEMLEAWQVVAQQEPRRETRKRDGWGESQPAASAIPAGGWIL
jgi:flagellar biosynthetic protein FliS